MRGWFQGSYEQTIESMTCPSATLRLSLHMNTLYRVQTLILIRANVTILFAKADWAGLHLIE
jgi:hypothetical protein